MLTESTQPSGFFLKKKPPFTALIRRARYSENALKQPELGYHPPPE
jgi:hypothetical protein